MARKYAVQAVWNTPKSVRSGAWLAGRVMERTASVNLRAEIDEAVGLQLRELAAQSGYRQYVAPSSANLCLEVMRSTASSDALLLSSATAAAEVVLRAAGVTAGDAVLLSGYDYPGNFWAIERVGGRPYLLDVKPGGWGLCPDAVEEAVRQSQPKRIKALIASHLHGQLQPIERLREICDANNVLLIEDACQSWGAVIPTRMGDKPAGSVGHVGLVSFGGGKVISAGRGGAAVTSDAGLAQKMRLAAGAGSGPYALSEVSSAIVLAQLPFLHRINALAAAYFGELAMDLDARWQVPWRTRPHGTAFYNAGLMLREDNHALAAVKQKLREAGTTIGDGFVGFHRRSGRRCDRTSDLTHTQHAVERTVVLHHGLAIDGIRSAAHLAAMLNQAIS